MSYPKGKIVFSQGQPSDAVMYIQKGGIKISVLSRTGGRVPRSGLPQHPAVRRAEIALVGVTRSLRLRTSASHSLLPPILTGRIADVCTLWSAQSVCFGVCVEEAARRRGFDVP